METISAGGITSPKGFSAGAICSGIKNKSIQQLDLAILFSEAKCKVAAMFTTNQVKAAPVIFDQNRIEQTGEARAVVVNSGCANACTGEQGILNARMTAEIAARHLNVAPDEILLASTGVIGVQLPIDKINAGLSKIRLSPDNGHQFAEAIMTTDTKPKEIAIKVSWGDSNFNIGGAAKGAGMIHPDMATLLGFITTDAAVDTAFLKESLDSAVAQSFNMISVDGDTSTNDTVMLFANGLAGNKIINHESDLAKPFQLALTEVCIYLARCIARDGEGATRLIEVLVEGAASLADARKAAKTIVSSPLVKAAVHGCDPNWGRILAAAGRSGALIQQDLSDIFIENICLLRSGVPLPFDKKDAAAALSLDEVALRLNLNIGPGSAKAWGCDLSEEYVVINSEYTS